MVISFQFRLSDTWDHHTPTRFPHIDDCQRASERLRTSLMTPRKLDLTQKHRSLGCEHARVRRQPHMGMKANNGRLIEGMIANLPIFRQAARAHLGQLAHSARPRELRRGETVCRRGERVDGVYALAYGLVKLTFGREDEEKVLSLIGPGETFGEEAVFLDRPSPVEASALADSMVIMIPSPSLFWLIDRDSRFARAMISSLSLRMQGLVDDVEAGALQTGMQRVAGYLDSLADPGSGQTSVHLPATKTVIAARLGITKETLSRLLHDLAEQKVVTVSKRDVALHDRTRLAAIAHGAETCPTQRGARRAATGEAFDEDQHS